MLRRNTLVRQSKTTPKVPHQLFCKGCFIYETRVRRAFCELAMTGEAGIWDYAVCYDSCIKEDKSEVLWHKNAKK